MGQRSGGLQGSSKLGEFPRFRKQALEVWTNLAMMNVSYDLRPSRTTFPLISKDEAQKFLELKERVLGVFLYALA